MKRRQGHADFRLGIERRTDMAMKRCVAAGAGALAIAAGVRRGLPIIRKMESHAPGRSLGCLPR